MTVESAHYQLRFIYCCVSGQARRSLSRHTAFRKHCPNFSNSCLQQSLRTSAYVATMHFPYAVASDAQVVVVCRAKRFSGLGDFGADCMTVWSKHAFAQCVTLHYQSLATCWHRPTPFVPKHVKDLSLGCLYLRAYSFGILPVLLQPPCRGCHWAVPKNQVLE